MHKPILLLIGLQAFTTVPAALAADFFGTRSTEYALHGSTTIEVPDALVRRKGEAAAVEQALSTTHRYQDLNHFVSAFFIDHHLDGFSRGSPFATEGFEKLADGRYRVDFS